MQLYERPRSSGSIFKRFGGMLRETMDFLPETTAWFTTKSTQKQQDVYQKRPQSVFNTATSFVQQRESFAGQPGKLYTARSNVLSIEDPVARAQGLSLIDKLQAMPLPQQQSVLAFLSGQSGTLNVPGQEALVEQTLGDLAAVDVTGDTVNIQETGQTGLAGQSLYTALTKAFPGIDLNVEDQDMADRVLTDISEAAIEPALKSPSANFLADTLEGIHTGETSLAEALWKTPLAVAGVASEYTFGALGKAADEIGAEGIADDVASLWDNVEQGLSDELVGYYDPALDQYHKGLLNHDLEVDYNDPASVNQFMMTTEQRGNAFGLLMLFGGGAVAVAGGAVGRRVKTIRGLVGTTDEAVLAALPTNIKAKGTGTLDQILETYRSPARATQNAFDRMAVALFRISPDKFFQESMFGRLYERGGVKLIKALHHARAENPGGSQAALDKQVGWMRQRYGTQVPDALLREMLTAPSVEEAKFRFVQYASTPQGPETMRALIGQINARKAKLTTATDTIVEGEDGIEWNKNLERYNELASPEAQRRREETFGEVESGMDASLWADADPRRKQALINVVREEAELADLRVKLGFTPHTRDRFGQDWKPSDAPARAVPAEGETLDMPLHEVNRLADPELWDPNTSQATRTDIPGAYEDTLFAPAVNSASWDPWIQGAMSGYSGEHVYKFLTREQYDAARAQGLDLTDWREFYRLQESPRDAVEMGDIPDADMAGGVLIRVPRSQGGQVAPPTRIEVYDAADTNMRWKVAGDRSVPGDVEPGMSIEAMEVAERPLREVIQEYAGMERYAHLGRRDQPESFVIDMMGEDNTLNMDADELEATLDEIMGERVSLPVDGAWMVDVPHGPGGQRTIRFYWIENEEGDVAAMLTAPVYAWEADGVPRPSIESITLQSLPGPDGMGNELLQAIVQAEKPDPNLLLHVLKTNVLSRKGVIATHRVLKKLVQEKTAKVGKLSVPEFQALKDDIAENGIREPLEVTVNPNTGEAVASEGFHRWMAAQELGLEEVPVKIDYDVNAKGQQFYPVEPRPRPTAQQLQGLSRERLAIQLLEERLSHTHDDMPMVHYPKQSIVRASLRAPRTRAERYLAGVIRVGTAGIDPLKFVDELPSRPTMYVPENGDNPADWMDRNTTTIEHVLHRVGVPRDEAAEAIGKLGRIRNSQEFYEVLEKEIFGDGGLVDRHLAPSIAADKTLRGRLIYLHGRSPETRTRSLNRTYIETGAGRTSVDQPVLATQKGGESVPIPSRPTEFLREVALPATDDLIEASSMLRRVIRNMEKRGVGNVNAAAPYNLAKLLMHVQTATLKGLVMLVRLPAMGMRIQLEQTLRLGTSGYRPFKGLPDGLTIFPGGIPVPFTRRLAGLGGAELPDNIRVLGGMFGNDGWNLMDPDPNYRGASQLPPNTEIGGFLEENVEHGDAEVHAVGTQELREDPSRITKHHLESHRKELEQANTDWLDRRIAAAGLNRNRIKEWLLKSRRGRQFMDTNMRPQLERSTYYANPANPDGMVIELDAAELAKYVEFPHRLNTENPVGRTPEQIEELRSSLANGYDPNYVGPSGQAEGLLTLEFDPATSKAIVREGHHRIGIMAENGQRVQVRVQVTDGTPPVRGLDIDEFDGNDLMSELSELSPTGSGTGRVFDMDRFTSTPEARYEGAIDRWLDARVEYLKGITREDPDLIDFISTGKLRSQRNVTVRKYDNSGRSIAQRHSQVSNDVNNVRAELARRNARGDRWSGDAELESELVALQITLRKRERELADLLDEFPDELGTVYHRAGDKKGFRDALRQKWESNPDSIPDRIMLESGTYRRDPDLGLTEDMHRWAAAASSAMYRPFKALSYVDRHGTRGSLWTQAYARSMKKYKAYGYTQKQARALSYAEAGNVTRDLMYDLNARTSVQRAMRDLFWFAPATQEVLYTWLVKIPSQSYWPLGAASLVAKGRIGLNIMEEMGVISENAEGEKIIEVPFLGKMIETFSGGTVKVPDMQFGKLEGLNLVTTGGGVPGLSTLGNFALGRASLKWGGLAKEMSDIFQPYGPEASMLPQPITFLHEAVFGEAPPFEPLSGAYTKAQWDRAFDQSIQYAYHELSEDGITPPRIEDFGTKEDGRVVLSPEQEAEYQAASTEYLTELMDLGKDYAQGYAWTRLLGSTVMPMSIYVTSKEREGWDKFWADLMGEGEGSGEMTDQQRELVTDYLSEHPHSLAFSVFTTKYGAKKRDLPFAESNDDAYFDAYYTEQASTLTPDEYSQKLMAMESKRFYQAQLDKSLREISPNLDPWELLRNAGSRSRALTEYQEEWQRYLDLNPEADALLSAQTRSWAESQDIPKRSFEAERLATTLSLLKQITPMLTGEEGVRSSELRAVQGQISELYGNTNEFPEASTPTAKAMEWWYSEVLDPYLDKSADLYDEAEDLQSRGLDASGVYEELRVLANTPPPSYKGKGKGSVPSVEEFFWGNKTAPEQEAAKVTWASRPVSWLTDFQLGTVGYNVSEKGSVFLREVASFDEWFYNEIERRDIASGSEDYDKWQQFRDERLAEAANAVGPEAVKLLALNEATPITRIMESGYGRENAAFRDIAETAQWVAKSIEDKGYSAKSYSDFAMEWKSWFYGEVAGLAQTNPGVARLLQDLERSFPMDNGGFRQDIVLFEAVFFGNFNEDFIPQELALLGGR